MADPDDYRIYRKQDGASPDREEVSSDDESDGQDDMFSPGDDIEVWKRGHSGSDFVNLQCSMWESMHSFTKNGRRRRIGKGSQHSVKDQELKKRDYVNNFICNDCKDKLRQRDDDAAALAEERADDSEDGQSVDYS
jgi:hypothetical protein